MVSIKKIAQDGAFSESRKNVEAFDAAFAPKRAIQSGAYPHSRHLYFISRWADFARI